MTDTLYLPDGTMAVLFGPEDFRRIVMERLGLDAARQIDLLTEAADRETIAANSDLASYEATLDSHLDVFNDLLEDLEFLQKHLDKPRMRRTAMLAIVMRMQKIISNEI